MHIPIPITKAIKVSTSNFGLVRLVSLTGGPYSIPYASPTNLSSIEILIESDKSVRIIIGTRTNQSESQSDPLLQKRFLGAGEIIFLGADTTPVPVQGWMQCPPLKMYF